MIKRGRIGTSALSKQLRLIGARAARSCFRCTGVFFALASHGWTEPIERALAAARDAGAVVITPRPGQSVEPTVERPQERWWPALPWRTEAENPIVADHADRGSRPETASEVPVIGRNFGSQSLGARPYDLGLIDPSEPTGCTVRLRPSPLSASSGTRRVS